MPINDLPPRGLIIPTFDDEAVIVTSAQLVDKWSMPLRAHFRSEEQAIAFVKAVQAGDWEIQVKKSETKRLTPKDIE